MSAQFPIYTVDGREMGYVIAPGHGFEDWRAFATGERPGFERERALGLFLTEDKARERVRLRDAHVGYEFCRSCGGTGKKSDPRPKRLGSLNCGDCGGTGLRS